MSVHPTAIVAPGARIAPTAQVGPFCVIGPDVEIGEGTHLFSHSVVDGHTRIGRDCRIYSGACLGTDPQDRKYQGGPRVLEIGDGNILREYVTISPGSKPGSKTSVGDRNFIMISAHIGHDCVVGSDNTFANSVGLAGYVTIEDQVTLGGFVGVHQFCRIGRLSMVGAVSKVAGDVAPFSLYDGPRARFYGVNAVGLKRAGFDSKRLAEVKKTLTLLLASGLAFSTAEKRVLDEIGSTPDTVYILSFFRASERGVLRKAASD